MEYKIEKVQILEALNLSGLKLIESCDEMYHYESQHSYFRYRVNNYIIDVGQKDSFDRWANSTCANIIPKMVNYHDEEGDWGWKEIDVINDIIEKVKDCDTINRLLPKKLFDKFLKYEI